MHPFKRAKIMIKERFSCARKTMWLMTVIFWVPAGTGWPNNPQPNKSKAQPNQTANCSIAPSLHIFEENFLSPSSRGRSRDLRLRLDSSVDSGFRVAHGAQRISGRWHVNSGFYGCCRLGWAASKVLPYQAVCRVAATRLADVASEELSRSCDTTASTFPESLSRATWNKLNPSARTSRG